MNGEGRPVVFIVEDNEPLQEAWQAVLEDAEVEVIAAYTINEALMKFEANHPIIDVVVMDAELATKPKMLQINATLATKPNTLHLVEMMRWLGFTKPIIAASGNSNWRGDQLCAGCSHAAEKGVVVNKVLELVPVLVIQ